jgi:hypothetical protein
VNAASAEHARKKAALEVRTAAETLRSRGRRAAPGRWISEPAPDNTTRLVSRDGDPTTEVAVLTGPWAPTTALYLMLMVPDIAYRIAELMTRSETLIRQGHMPSSLRDAVVDVAHAINGLADA